MNDTDTWVPRLGHPDPSHPFNKQWTIFNSRSRYLLVSGSRKSGKTYAVQHRVVRHLWETPEPRVAVFAKSIGLAKDGGCWQSLIERIIPEWVNAGIGFKVTTKDREGNPGPQNDSTTKSVFFRTTNAHGGESECRLFSIHNDNDVFTCVKNKEFSMMWFIELSMFKDPRVFFVSLQQLRLPHLRPAPGEVDIWHQWIGDTNPDEELGNKSWFYKIFYVDRMKADKQESDETAEDFLDRKDIYSSMEVVEMFMPDNPYLTRMEKAELRVLCRGDQALTDSYVLGIHGDGGQKRSKHFASIFSHSQHVIGGGEDGDQIDVNRNTTTLYTGWDIGAVSNHAAGIVDKWTSIINGKERSNFSVLDEVTSFDERILISDFALEMLAKMERLERIYGKQFEWINYCDDTATNVWRPISGTFDYLEVEKASKGKIILDGVHKPDGSVRTRVRLIRRLLIENRLFVSARCTRVISMLEECRKGDTKDAFVLWDVHKHTFDWLSYIIFQELLEELQELDDQTNTVAPKPQIISVG